MRYRYLSGFYGINTTTNILYYLFFQRIRKVGNHLAKNYVQRHYIFEWSLDTLKLDPTILSCCAQFSFVSQKITITTRNERIRNQLYKVNNLQVH